MIDKLAKALQRLDGYPRFEGQRPIAVIYHWLSEAGLAEHRIYEVMGARGYLHAAAHVALNPTEEAYELFGNAIEETFPAFIGGWDDAKDGR